MMLSFGLLKALGAHVVHICICRETLSRTKYINKS